MQREHVVERVTREHVRDEHRRVGDDERGDGRPLGAEATPLPGVVAAVLESHDRCARVEGGRTGGAKDDVS